MGMTRGIEVHDETAPATEAQDWLALAAVTHARRLYGIAYRVLRNAPDAEDCVQEALLRAWRYRKRQEIANEAAWLARITWRTALDRKGRRTAFCLEEVDGDSRLRSSGQTPEESAADREMLARVEQMIAALPRKLRDPLILSVWGEMDASEIAAVLELSPASVRSRLLRARRQLKDRLLQQEGKS